MSIESKFYGILADTFNGELYPVRHPDPDGKKSSVSDLFAIYLKIGGQSLNKLEGDAGVSRVRMQLSIYATDYDVLKTAEYGAIAAMRSANDAFNQSLDTEGTGALPNVTSTVPLDGYESDTKRFYTHIDFYCWAYD